MAKIAPGRLTLPEREWGPLRSIGVRIFIAFACLVVTASLVYFERDGYRDLDRRVDTWLDAFYYATVTLSTTGYGDITPESDSARLLNVVLITPLRFLFLIVLIGTTIEVLTERGRQQFRYSRWRKRVKNHTIVVGYGVKGRSAVSALKEHGCRSESIVVVDSNGANVKVATADGCVGVLGDARSAEVLAKAEIQRADRVIVAADRDDTSILVTLTARRLAPTATIATTVREEQNIGLMRQGGADVVIPTAESAGRLLGLSSIAPHAGQVMEDLLEPVEGLQIVERDVTRADFGLSLAEMAKRGEMVISVVRDGVTHRFDSGEVEYLERNDRIVIIRSNPHATKSGDAAESPKPPATRDTPETPDARDDPETRDAPDTP